MQIRRVYILYRIVTQQLGSAPGKLFMEQFGLYEAAGPRVKYVERV